MALARYREIFWFPNGVPAANTTASVFPVSSSALASLFTDMAGTTPLLNPLATDAAGVLEFYAQEGEYWIHIGTDSFRVQVGSPDSDVFEIAASSNSTGIVWGGDIAANAGTPSSLDIDPLVGYVVDDTTDQIRPTAIRLATDALTVPMDAASLARPVTHWLMDSAGSVFQQGTRPTSEERRERIYLGLSVQAAGSITVTQSLPVILAQPDNQFVDLLDDLGPFSCSGNVVTANGANLMIDKSQGVVFSRAFSHFVAGSPTRDPHQSTSVAQSPVSFRYTTQAEAPLGANTTLVDPTQRDSGGVLVPVGGGANTATVQRIWLIPADNVANQVVVQYGQTAFSSLASAVNAIGSGAFVPRASIREVAGFLGWLAVVRTAADLSDQTKAVFITAGKFDTP